MPAPLPLPSPNLSLGSKWTIICTLCVQCVCYVCGYLNMPDSVLMYICCYTCAYGYGYGDLSICDAYVLHCMNT